jgi:hypothetical protein
MASEEQSNVPVTVQLVKYKPVPWLFRNDLPEPPVKTPSEWFSKRWPEQAETFGTPFLEAKLHDGDLEQHVNPLSLNEIFFAGILAGNQELGHKVVYYTPGEEFYFKDPREGGIFKPTFEEKLKTLLSLYILECAEQLKDTTPKLNLFVRFRKDDELQKVVNKAKSLLAVDKSFFGADSPNIRTGGEEEKEKVAKTFISLVIELNPQNNMTLADTYAVFREFSGKQGVKLVERRHFEDLAGDIIKEQYGLALRNDILNGSGRHQRGWRGLGLRQEQLSRLGLNKN